MSKLIAVVATAVLVGSVRTIIQPGEELPDLPEHDARELVQSGAAENPSETALLGKADALMQAAADAEFESMRRAVQESKASTAEPEAKATKAARK